MGMIAYEVQQKTNELRVILENFKMLLFFFKIISCVGNEVGVCKLRPAVVCHIFAVIKVFCLFTSVVKIIDIALQFSCVNRCTVS